MSWYDHARAAIAEVDAILPSDVSFAIRKDAVALAYPFGDREHWPYKGVR
jgi:hypothetical protein